MCLYQTKITHKLSISFIRLQEVLYPGYSRGGSRAYHGNTGHEGGIHPEGD